MILVWLCILRFYEGLAANTDRNVKCATLGGLPTRKEFAHAVEGAKNILGRIGVAEPHVALAEDAEVGTADDGNAGVLQQRGRERLCLPARAFDVGEGVERASGR